MKQSSDVKGKVREGSLRNLLTKGNDSTLNIQGKSSY